LKRNKDGNIEVETFRSMEVSKTCSRMERKCRYGKQRDIKFIHIETENLNYVTGLNIYRI